MSEVVLLRITEAMSNGDIADWFEVTNFGSNEVNIIGYKMDDMIGGISPSVPVSLFGITSVAPWESAVFLEGNSATVTTFKTNWGLGSQTQVGYYAGSGIGLSSGGDGVTLFDAAGNELSGATNSSYLSGKIRVSFGAANTGHSFRWAYTTEGEFSGSMETSIVGDIHGAVTSANKNVGSPGAIPEPSSLSLLALGGVVVALRRRKK